MSAFQCKCNLNNFLANTVECDIHVPTTGWSLKAGFH